jgi:hypothetical protein
MSENAKKMEKYVGKTIASIEDISSPLDWACPDPFIIKFTDGTQVEITAEQGQGIGYVIVDENEWPDALKTLWLNKK